MATFSQYVAAHRKSPAPRQATWLCGPESVLVEEILTDIIETLGPDPWNIVRMSAEEDSERSIWATLDQHPLGTSVRVVVIRHAQQIKNWDRFLLWAKNHKLNPRTYVVLISDEPGVPKTEVTQQERRRGAKPQPLPHIAALDHWGRVVECKPFTSATTNTSLEWVKAKVPMRDPVARHLLTRANWDLRLVRDICFKLSVFPGEPTIQVVNTIMEEQPRDELVDALMALDRRTALLAAQRVDPGEIGRIIGLLDSRLEKAALIHDMQSSYATTLEMRRALGGQAFLLHDYLQVAKHYDSKRLLSIRGVLATADAAYQTGQKVGVLETLISLW